MPDAVTAQLCQFPQAYFGWISSDTQMPKKAQHILWSRKFGGYSVPSFLRKSSTKRWLLSQSEFANFRNYAFCILLTILSPLIPHLKAVEAAKTLLLLTCTDARVQQCVQKQQNSHHALTFDPNANAQF